MRVFMLGSAYTGCNYVRVRLPSYENGFLTDTNSLKGERNSNEQIRDGIMSADVVVMHRPEIPEYHRLAVLAKSQGKKLVMDNDDTFLIDDNHPLAEVTPDAETITLKERQESITTFMEHCDLVTTTTETLAKEYRKTNPNVVILPNCVDPDDWDEPLRNEGDKVRIGFVNSVAYEYDYEHIKDFIQSLGDRDDVEVILFGLGDKEHRKKNPKITKMFENEYKFWDGVVSEHISWVHISDYPQMLNELRLDMILIPRKDNYFNRCKSNLKFLEASMCEIPVVAQSLSDGPYEEITPDMGILIKNNKDWSEAVESLIQNKEKRREMGRKAREYVIKNYNIKDKAHLWEEAYNNLF